MTQALGSSSSFSVSSQRFVPLSASQLWLRLAGPGHLPGSRLETQTGRRVRFRHSGVKGWLPIEEPTGEVAIEEAPGGGFG